MEILVKAGQLILSLSILIVLHEMGHFLIAKAFKTRVEKFYLFFDAGFSLFKKKVGETEYGIGWLPLGGYVKISGMIDESMDKEALKKPPQPWEFRSKKAWQRLLIMLGGVMVNFLLGLVLFIIVFYTWGERYVPNANLKYGIVTDSIGHEIGLRNGDKILKLDGAEVERYTQVAHDLLINEVQVITVERNDSIVNIHLDDEILPRLLKNETELVYPRIPFGISEIIKGMPAESAGVLPGDKVIGLNGESISFYDEFQSRIGGKPNLDFTMTVEREQELIDIPLKTDEFGRIGIYSVSFVEYLETVEMTYTFFESIPAGIIKGWETTRSYLKSLSMLFKPKKYKAHESLGGFIKIGSFFPSVWDWQSFWNLTAFLSIMLAIMNLLPIPALDGGHVMFLLYEIISGRKPGDKFLEYAQIVGMVLLLSLLLYANLNDIIGLFKR
ncbi:RIP metalloprotease RseP [Bacteroidota bacterium]